jgi:hypothetical protein
MAEQTAQEVPVADFDVDNRIAAAVAEAGSDDFGDPLFVDDVRAYLDAITTEANISPVGGLGLQHLVHGLLVNRLRYHADLTAHPEIADEDVSDPIVVAGLFRTGTTKLQRMLSSDPGVQELTFWRLLNVAPLPAAVPGEPDPRIAIARDYIDALASQSPEFMAAHPWIVDEPDEDSLLLWLTFDHLAGGSVGYIPTFVERVQARDQRRNYDYLAGVLRYMQWQDGGRRDRPWVLKSPTHVGSIEAILAAFPRATIAFCHREPAVIVPSFVRLFEIFWGLFGNAVDPREVGRPMLELWSAEMLKGLEQRDRLGDDRRIIDIYYDDIVANPVEVIRRIYDQHGRPLTPEAETAFADWERDNPQHKFGKHSYSLESCGVTEDEVCAAFAPYLERFPRLRTTGIA